MLLTELYLGGEGRRGRNCMVVGFTTTVKPVLANPCIEQLPVLSDRFHSSQQILLYTLTVFNDPLPYVTSDCLFSAV